MVCVSKEQKNNKYINAIKHIYFVLKLGCSSTLYQQQENCWTSPFIFFKGNIPENKLFNSVKSQLTYENLPKVWQLPETKYKYSETWVY